MRRPVSIILQLVFYLAAGAAVIYFATSPPYDFFPADQAEIKMSFKHSGERIIPCKRLTPEEIAKLPPNERRPTDCPRGRHPLVVEVLVDGEQVFGEALPPSGLFGDGPAKVYARFRVVEGRHVVSVRMRETGTEGGFDFEKTETVDLAPREILVIDFIPAEGGFVFK